MTVPLKIARNDLNFALATIACQIRLSSILSQILCQCVNHGGGEKAIIRLPRYPDIFGLIQTAEANGLNHVDLALATVIHIMDCAH